MSGFASPTPSQVIIHAKESRPGPNCRWQAGLARMSGSRGRLGAQAAGRPLGGASSRCGTATTKSPARGRAWYRKAGEAACSAASLVGDVGLLGGLGGRGRNGGLDRLHGVLRQGADELSDLRRVSDETVERLLGEIGLHFDGLVERLDADELLERGGAGFELLLGEIGDLAGDRLEALRHRAEVLHGRIHPLPAEFLVVVI